MKRHARYLAPLLALVLLTGCDDGSGPAPSPSPTQPPTPGPSPSPSPTPTPPAGLPNAEALEAAIEASPVADIHVLIGTREGVAFSYQKGRQSIEDTVPIASATKILAGVTILRLVEAGEMSLDDKPGHYLNWWTTDPMDPRSEVTLEHLLSFTSGFNVPETDGGCITSRQITMQECAREFYERDLDTPPGTTFAYGPAHLQIAGAMAEAATGRTFVDLFDQQVRGPSGMSTATEIRFPSRTNPRLSGGGFSNARDFGSFLTALLDRRMLSDIADYTRDRTDGLPMINSPTGSTGASWQYALASWKECDDAAFTPACAQASLLSSPGVFGWTPWIDFDRGYWGLVAMRDRPGSQNGVRLEQHLQSLVEPQFIDR